MPAEKSCIAFKGVLAGHSFWEWGGQSLVRSLHKPTQHQVKVLACVWWVWVQAMDSQLGKCNGN